MLNLVNLLVPTDGNLLYVYRTLSIVLIALMALSAIAIIILILLQPSNSSGIDALGGSSETFFGKNKGKSIEAKMKKWTWICLAILAVLSIIFFILQIDSLWV
ncbi:MAG: preprotein translocase subunit SecG [Clostridia bacterium]|nr:preprotein translocase subunit SecG [Clostridia bacterium]